MALTIRQYQPDDKEKVKALSFAGLAQMGINVTPDHLVKYDSDLDAIEDVYLNNRGEFLIGTMNGDIVVMGGLRAKTHTCGEIKRIRVHRDYQRRGYARAIIERLIEAAPALGYEELVLDTLTDNYGAQQLFQSCGFVESERGTRGEFSLLFYRKPLDSKK